MPAAPGARAIQWEEAIRGWKHGPLGRSLTAPSAGSAIGSASEIRRSALAG